MAGGRNDAEIGTLLYGTTIGPVTCGPYLSLVSMLTCTSMIKAGKAGIQI